MRILLVGVAAFGLATSAAGAVQERRLVVEPIGRVRLFTPYLVTADDEGRIARYQPAPADAATSHAVEVARPNQTAWEATALTPARVARSLAEGGEVEEVGRFTSLAIGPAVGGREEDFSILFSWRSHGRGQTRMVLGQWQSRSDELHIAADTATIADAAGIGASPVLLEVSVFVSGDRMLTLLRDFDRARLFSRSLDDVGLGRLVDLDRDAAVLHRDHLVVVPDRAGGLLVTDLEAGAAWHIEDNGAMREVATFAGLPQVMSNVAPLEMTAEGELGSVIAFAANTSPRPGRARRAAFPAAVIFDPQTPAPDVIVGRDKLENPGELSLYMLSLENLVPAGPRSVVGVDPVTGRIIRLRLEAPPAGNQTGPRERP